MSYISDDDVIDDGDNTELNSNITTDEKSETNSAAVRKKIDDLLEKKRLKELLDDTDDW